MAKKGSGKKAQASDAPATKATNGTSVYEAAVKELKSVADDEGARRRIESGVLREGRGQDVLRLHTTLKAIDTSHQELASTIQDLHEEVNGRFDKTWDTVGTNFDKTWDTVGKKFDKTWETVGQNFEKTWDTVDKKFDKTWETLGHNFDATNERTRREVADLRDEVTKILDKRFTHIDQTFASIRADIEVVKALQMELIKERIGRPELLKR